MSREPFVLRIPSDGLGPVRHLFGFEEAHEIGVDSGTIWVGDPCYIVGNQDDDDAWGDFCDPLDEAERKGRESAMSRGGVHAHTTYGDYPSPTVYIRLDPETGRPAQIVVDLARDLEGER